MDWSASLRRSTSCWHARGTDPEFEFIDDHGGEVFEHGDLLRAELRGTVSMMQRVPRR